MKKIGILTYYYNTHNYGGILQAYALTYYLNNYLFLDTKQICYSLEDERPFDKSYEEKNQKTVKRNTFLERVNIKIKLKKYNNTIKPHFVNRNKKFKQFEKKISHTDFVYNLSNISDCNDLFDVFITGSDQIWTFKWFNPTFYLEFANDDKQKLSYAASMGKSQLSVNETKYLQKVLSSFSAISVREKDLLSSISKCVPQLDSQLVLDPTLLLQENDWQNLVNDNLIKGDYIFCYFLGEDKEAVKIIKQFSKRKKLKIVNIPFANEGFNITDFNFGDIKIYDAGPEDFLTLIKYSSYVFTDSFHASVFSLIFKKEFYCFERNGIKGMSSRLYTLTQIFNCEERFCDTEEKRNINYILNLKEINFDFHPDYLNLRNQSINYLKKYLLD